jgi:transposase InsO family protein
VVDLTYLRTWAGFAYLTLVTDVVSHRIVGWALATHRRTDLPLEALELAIWTRHRQGVDDLTGLIHHGDRGRQCLSIKYTERLAEADVVASVGSGGDSYDNALAESTFGQDQGRTHPPPRPVAHRRRTRIRPIRASRLVDSPPPTRRDRHDPTRRKEAAEMKSALPNPGQFSSHGSARRAG